MYRHRFFLKLKSYRLHFCNKKKIEYLIIFDCTLPLRVRGKLQLYSKFVYEGFRHC